MIFISSFVSINIGRDCKPSQDVTDGALTYSGDFNRVYPVGTCWRVLMLCKPAENISGFSPLISDMYQDITSRHFPWISHSLLSASRSISVSGTPFVSGT